MATTNPKPTSFAAVALPPVLGTSIGAWLASIAATQLSFPTVAWTFWCITFVGLVLLFVLGTTALAFSIFSAFRSSSWLSRANRRAGISHPGEQPERNLQVEVFPAHVPRSRRPELPAMASARSARASMARLAGSGTPANPLPNSNPTPNPAPASLEV